VKRFFTARTFRLHSNTTAPDAPVRDTNAPDGFSLVEATLGLILAGLMVTSIFKGYAMIREARLHKTAGQIVSLQEAYHHFVTLYGAKPGDCDYASFVLGVNARDGNGNGLVEGAGRESHTEATTFWHHLATAELLPLDVQPPSTALCLYGAQLPSCVLGGGFTVEESPDDFEGLWMILGKASGSRGNGGLLTPQEAAFLNKRLDNGNPLTGRVQSREGYGVPAGRCITANGLYNMALKERACVLYVFLD